MFVTKEQFKDSWSRWDDLILKQPGVDFNVVKTIMMIESSLGLNPHVARGLANPEDVGNSASEDGLSWGLLQMRPSTAWAYDPSATPGKLNVPEYAVEVGCKHMAHLTKLFVGVPEWISKAWNQGATATLRERDNVAPGHADAYWIKYQAYRALL